MKTLLQTDFELLEEKSEMIRTLGHPIRLCIVQLLTNKKKLTVTEIYSALEIEQAVASHHLRIMKNSKILTSAKIGKNAFYSLADPSYKKLLKVLFP